MLKHYLLHEWVQKQEGMGIEFKYTAPGISQQNEHVKWKFATLNTFTLLEDKHIWTFWVKGERGILTLVWNVDEMLTTTHLDSTHWANLVNYGTPGIWFGFLDVHPVGLYHTLNPKQKKHLSEDMTFLEKSYCKWTILKYIL